MAIRCDFRLAKDYAGGQSASGAPKPPRSGAFAHDFIPEKAAGTTPSFGEHGGATLRRATGRRLCIARAILRQTPILILDEATSQWTPRATSDSAGDRNGHCTKRRRSSSRIGFSTIQSADTIVVLEKGEIIGQGKHAELLKTCEVYQQLYERRRGG